MDVMRWDTSQKIPMWSFNRQVLESLRAPWGQKQKNNESSWEHGGAVQGSEISGGAVMTVPAVSVAAVLNDRCHMDSDKAATIVWGFGERCS